MRRSNLLSAAGILAVVITLAPAASAQGLQAAVAQAQTHVERNVEDFGLAARDVSGLAVSDAYVSKHTGVTHVYLQQEHQGIPVHNAIFSAAVLRDGTVAHAASRLLPELTARVTSTGVGLSAEAAVEAAARHLGLAPSGPVTVLEREPGAVRKTVLSPAGLSADPIKAQLVYQPMESGEVRLAWQVTIEMIHEPHWWRIRLDASTGEVLDQSDLVDHDTWGAPATATAGHTHEGTAGLSTSASSPGSGSSTLMPDSYRVYPFPFESPQHGASHDIVIDPLGNAPAGTYPGGMTSWHDTDGDGSADFTDTRGNNVDAYTDRDGDDVPDTGSRPDGGASLDFDFAIDLNQEPVNYSDGAVVNLFYWTNIIHDVVYQYGFDEAAGNFQVDNFGRGGVGGDDVRAEAQDDDDDGGGNCNANFGTDADGNRPKMQMYQCNDSTPERDGDLDAGVIAHEYGHGISTRLTGGPAEDECLDNQEQMGEGWSDWYLLSLTQLASHTATAGRGVGTYLRGQGPNGNGIRPTHYSTDFAVNPTTYGDLPVQAIPHGVGYVWATMLWDLNWALIGDLFPEEGGAKNGTAAAGYVPGFDPDLYAGNGGNNLAQQLIMDGMKLQTCSPGFEDGRDAILAADQVLTGGANERIIWKTFARRGLGWSADQMSANIRSDGIEAFDMPPHLNRPPTADAGPDQTVECAAHTGAEVTLDGTGSSDPDETNPEPDVLTFEWSENGDVIATGAEPTVTLAKGVHVITLTVTDEHGETDTDNVQITIEDTTPPVLTVNSGPMSLWPPNHAYHPVLLDDLDMTVSDVCDADLGPDDVLIASAESDEPEDTEDRGDGATVEDIVMGAECRDLELRAERAMNGNGRVYTLGLAVADASDNVDEADFEVHVPINAKESPLAVLDSPAPYTVEGCAVVEAVVAEGSAAEVRPGDEADGRSPKGEGDGARSSAGTPTEYLLNQNYPNPFSAQAEITFGLPEPADVRLVVYDVLGREVAVLVDEPLGAGMHRVVFDASGLRSGTYLYRMVAGPAAYVRHMVLMR